MSALTEDLNADAVPVRHVKVATRDEIFMSAMVMLRLSSGSFENPMRKMSVLGAKDV